MSLLNKWTPEEAKEILWRKVLEWWSEHKDDQKWENFDRLEGEKIYEETPEFVTLAKAIEKGDK